MDYLPAYNALILERITSLFMRQKIKKQKARLSGPSCLKVLLFGSPAYLRSGVGNKMFSLLDAGSAKFGSAAIGKSGPLKIRVSPGFFCRVVFSPEKVSFNGHYRAFSAG